MSPTEVADQVLAFRGGDADARAELARRACRLALRTAAAILRDGEQARDVSQDVAVEVLQSLGRLRDPAAFDAWVHRITARHALQAARKRRGRERVELELEDAVRIGSSQDLDRALAARSALAGGLAKLPVRQRLALALRYVHDLSDDEIADALECRVGTVHALLSRGRAGLRADAGVIGLSKAMAGDG
jgi:RNA polymerase sigma-70 factor (ECF subfamily)